MTLYRVVDEKTGDHWEPIGIFFLGPRGPQCFLLRSSSYHALSPGALDDLTPEDVPLVHGELRLGPMSCVDFPGPGSGEDRPEFLEDNHRTLLERIQRGERGRVPVRRREGEPVVGFVEVSARGEVTGEGPADLEAAIADAREGIWILRDAFGDDGSQVAVPVVLTPDQFMFVEWVQAHLLWPLGYEAACPTPWL